jgi:AcrR family transcriptional regulator
MFQNGSGLSSTVLAVSASELPPVPRLPTRDGAGRRAGRPPRRRALTREAIVDAALSIVDAEGLDALTMRTVAHSLGTGAASLYAYVSSKEELLELVVERAIGEVRFEGEPDPGRWLEQMKSVAQEIRRMYARHGDLARASFGRIPLGERALEASEWMTGVLRAGGLPDQVVALAGDLLGMYVTATAYEESLYTRENVTADEFAQFTAGLRDYFASLPADRFPNLVELAEPLTASGRESRFDFGLEVLLRGLAAIPADWSPQQP